MSEEKTQDFWSVLEPVHLLHRGNNDREGINTFSPISLFVESLIQQLCMFLETKPELQRSLYLTVCKKLHEMNLVDETYASSEYNTLRGHYRDTLYKLLTVAKATHTNIENACPAAVQKDLELNSRLHKFFDGPRYDNEYREVGFIAEGGFGKVYKAQSKLDGAVYAIKKILIRFQHISSFLRPLQEIRTLAKLHHPNVVSYKTAWLEPLVSIESVFKTRCAHSLDFSTCKDATSRIPDTESSNIIFRKTDDEEPQLNCESVNKIYENKSLQRRINNSKDKISLSDTTSKNHGTKSSVSSTTDNLLCSYEKQVRRPNNCKESAILYIQMQLCYQTLRQWLDVRNSVEPVPINIESILRIFKKIVKGVAYIHSEGIVHHDIKPSNIFIGKDGKMVKIGDFGLACNAFSTDAQTSGIVKVSCCSCTNNGARKCAEFGTELYAAPEQWLGQMCTFKSDIYSVGIILFELINPFHTYMDRMKSIKALKSGLVPSSIILEFPKVAHLITFLMTDKPSDRPCASKVLLAVDKLLQMENIEDQELS